MGAMIEIRWHGRGGQGAKTAATSLAEAALLEGKYSQGYPDYGPERMGAPMRGFTRISENPIRVHCEINHPSAVAVLDPTLLGVVNVADGLQADGAIVVNTKDTPAAIRKRLGVSNVKVFTVDANSISMETIGRTMPNTPMLGALLKVTGALKLDTMLEDIKKKFGKKFSQKVVEGNLNAIRRAYEEVQGE
ncbi:MAG TPA: 2-oxoacid:acceptor oxidoreductase family protein [bacterium]|nr:2-oxoacid:acceptor oxidoreductase family protein [bacterium]